jgi:hypothetical protein
VKVLRNKFGIITGYAFWAIMLEYLTALDGQEMELNDLEVEMFASELGVEVKIAREMIEYSIKIEMLFVREVKGARFIYSEALNDKLKPVYEKRQHEREKSAARKRRENISAVEILPETHFDPISAADCGSLLQPAAEILQSKVKGTSELNKSELKESEVEDPPGGKSLSNESNLGHECIKIYFDFYRSKSGVKYPFNGGADGKAIKQIINYLKTLVTENSKSPATDEEVKQAWLAILNNYERWDEFHKTRLKLTQVRGNLANIILSIKNIKSKNNGSVAGKVRERQRIVKDWLTN